MKAAKAITEIANEKITAETLFSYLDNGIDDMVAGRVYTVDEAFKMIKDKVDIEL